jgi:hypothetical protein
MEAAVVGSGLTASHATGGGEVAVSNPLDVLNAATTLPGAVATPSRTQEFVVSNPLDALTAAVSAGRVPLVLPTSGADTADSAVAGDDEATIASGGGGIFGVFGDGSAGVFGVPEDSGAGVFGVATDSSPGVFGVAAESPAAGGGYDASSTTEPRGAGGEGGYGVETHTPGGGQGGF